MINLQTLTWATATEAQQHNRKIPDQKVGTVILLRTVILGIFAVTERESLKKKIRKTHAMKMLSFYLLCGLQPLEVERVGLLL